MGQSAIEGRVKHKIVFLGNQSVGKTSIIERYIYDAFDEKSNVFKYSIGNCGC